MYTQRLSHLISLLQPAGLDALALNPGPSLTYLTGLKFHLMERPVVLLITSSGQAGIVLAKLEAGKLDGTPLPIEAFTYQDNPESWPAAFQRASRALNLDQKKMGVEPNRLRVLELRYLESAAPGARFLSAESILSELRIHKEGQEILAIRQAAQIAQQALQATLPFIRPGITEREIAAELSIQLLRAGSDSDIPFSPIVSSGPNGANPHASPSERKLSSGDLLVIDWGASFQGYCSDITRTFAIGKPEPELELIYRVVQESNAAGRAACRPGIPAGKVDQAARAVIESSGYGQFFFHRTGHGLGMEGHEPPYIFSENPLILSAGMTFTIEPGIYLAGRGGVRIEDNILITEDSAESLTDLPRHLLNIG